MGVSLIQPEPRRKVPDYAIEQCRGHRAGGIEVSLEAQFGIRIQVHHGLCTLGKRRAIRLADGRLHFHFRRIENAHQRLTTPDLIAFLRRSE